MNLRVLTAAVFPTEAAARQKLWIFLKSCQRLDIDPLLYGIGTPQFPGYPAMKIDYQLRFLERLPADISHILYTDGQDAVVLGTLAEVEDKYVAAGSPPVLASASDVLGNVPDPLEDYAGCFNEALTYRYPCVGGYIAEVPFLIDALCRLGPTQPKHYGDDCFRWYDAWKDGWFRPVLDSNCEIFQVWYTGLRVEGKRVFNTITESYPCVLHLSGGYSDPLTGKDYRMEPWAKNLGIL